MDLLTGNLKYYRIYSANKMGKAKKIKVSKGETKIALADQIELEKSVKSNNRQKVRHRTDEDEEVGPCILYLVARSLKENLILLVLVID